MKTPSQKLPPLVSYRHQKCWRVIAGYETKNGIVHRISTKDNYDKTNKKFNLFCQSTDKAKLFFCHIVAESDGIERR